jgi:hypothetical protein
MVSYEALNELIQLGVGCFLAALDPRRTVHNCESVLKISGLWFARGVCERCE